MQLPDGTIIPSFLGVSTSTPMAGWSDQYDDTTLRVGRVLKAYSYGKEGNTNLGIEYDVEVIQTDSVGGYAPMVFHRCKMASLFGGVADFVKWTPRIGDPNSQTQFNMGSRVLLLCINGNRSDAYIIGGIPHPDNKATDTFDNNHHFIAEFNGVNISIDNDGTFMLLHRGATLPNGTIIDTKGENSYIRFSKEGNISLGYLEDSQKLPFFVLDKLDNKIFTYSTGVIQSVTQDEYVINTPMGVKINSGAPDQQAFVRGTTYRKNEQQMHNTIMTLLTQLSSLIQVAGSQLTVASAALPPALGPLSVAGAALNAAAVATDGIRSAIQSFETQSLEYLSNKHFHAEDMGTLDSDTPTSLKS